MLTPVEDVAEATASYHRLWSDSAIRSHLGTIENDRSLTHNRALAHFGLSADESEGKNLSTLPDLSRGVYVGLRRYESWLTHES